VATALGGCATSLNVVGDPYAAPAKFQFLRCEDIAKELAAAQAKDLELRALMDRSGSGVGGSTVNVLVYGPDLRQVESNLRQLRESAGEKRCSDAVIKTAPKTDIAPLH
jgi:phosphopantetheine adenylyltransferase